MSEHRELGFHRMKRLVGMSTAYVV